MISSPVLRGELSAFPRLSAWTPLEPPDANARLAALMRAVFGRLRTAEPAA